MKAKKKPKPYNWDTKVISAIRKVWRYSPERRAVLDAARDADDRRLVRCAACRQLAHEKLVVVDHIEPVVPTTGFDSWDAYIRRMMTNAQQVLCETCSKTKTKAENAERTRLRREKKKLCSNKKKS